MTLTASIAGFCAVTFLGYWFCYALLGCFYDRSRLGYEPLLDERQREQNRKENARLLNRTALGAAVIIAAVWLAYMHGFPK